MPLYSTLHRRHSRGFTLIELLAVIAIIAVLSTLILVGRGQIVKSADRSVCASNMRTVGQAVLMYANDNRGRFPPLNDLPDPNNPGGFLGATSWSNVVIPYLGGSEATKLEITRQTMRCPEQRKVTLEGTGRSDEKEITVIQQLRNFGFNTQLGPRSGAMDNWRTVASIQNPSRTLMLSESGMQQSFSCVALLDRTYVLQSTRGPDGVLRKGVHGDSNNVVWCDGSVSAWEDVSRLTRAPYIPGSPEDRWTGGGR